MNYTVYHLHSHLSNGTTNIDSCTKPEDYINYAKSLGMKALCFSEHGNIFNWYNKKKMIEEAGMKYIHGEEFYLTATLEDKVRDNFHCILIAKNYDGVLEINELFTKSYNRDNNHFYYVPRISFDELFSSSNNIIVTSACLGGVLNSGNTEEKKKFLDFFKNNKDRCFLEIQHHNVEEQKIYNRFLHEVSKKTGIKLIAGTDTHCLNKEHQTGRKYLQIGKNIHFGNEDNWDLNFKTYQELLDSYKEQESLEDKVFIEAIENTALLEDLVSSFDVPMDFKYPKIFDNPMKEMKDKINKGYKSNKYIKKYDINEIRETFNMELGVMDKIGALDYMLLEKYVKDWESENDIVRGPGRGSVSGSMVAYDLGITEMDSKKFDLNYFRFLNPSRVSLPDIDVDYSNEDRDKVKRFLLRDHMNLPQIKSAEIITFNTIALKGAIKDIGRAFGLSLDITQELSDAVEDDGKNQILPEKYAKKYSELYEICKIVTGTIVSIGTHPSGVLISDRDIEKNIGLCTLATSPYPVSCLNMKELDAQFYIKLDILGLDNVGLIKETCKLAGIDRLTPDNTPLDDENVWKSIRDDTTAIFQWESSSARNFLSKFMSDNTIKKVKKRAKNFSWIKWFSFGNGLIRPACASFRDEVADGKFFTNGIKELDDFLAPTMGRISMQEDIMKFLVKFCGYNDAESDNVRRCVDGDTDILLENGKVKKIKDIAVGDMVITVDEDSWTTTVKPVENVYDNGVADVYEITTERGNTILATKEHKFMTFDGYKKLSDLSVKDSLLTPMPKTYRLINSDLIPVKIKSIKYIGEKHVYDIGVKDNHNYFASGIWVHNCIAKKKGTDKLLPEIEERFVKYTHEHFGVPIDKCKEVAPSMIQVIKDASDYGFSWNHSDAYSCIGYICGYLRYYYPLEFITAALNIFHDKEEKTNAIVKYANKIGVKIENIKFRKSTEKYALDKENNTIYKGLESIKFISAQSARELYDLRSINFSTFTDLLVVLMENTKVDTRQIRVLITLNFFSEFGKNGKLLDIFIKFCDRYKKTYVEKTKVQRIEEIKSYELSCKNYDISLADQIECELEFLGYISVKFNCSERWFYIVDVDNRYTPKLTLYCLKDGNVVNYKMDKKKFKKTMVKPKSVIFIKSFMIKPDWKKDGDNFVKTGSYSKVITDYVIVDTQKFDELNKKHGSKG